MASNQNQTSIRAVFGTADLRQIVGDDVHEAQLD
jgi:hypothetical protein